MSISDIQAMVNYYARQGHYHHVQTVCSEVLSKKRHKNESVLRFWSAVSLFLQGSKEESIRQLSDLCHDRDVEFPTTIALIHIHKLSDMMDHDAISSLQKDLSPTEERASDASLTLCATFLWHIRKHSGAKRIVDKVLNRSPNFFEAQTLRGWIDLTAPQKTAKDKERQSDSCTLFSKSISAIEKGRAGHLEALMGLGEYYLLKQQYSKSLDYFNQAIVMYNWFLPALAEKCKGLLLMGDWNQALEVANRMVESDPHDIECLMVTVLFLATRELQPSLVATKVESLLHSLERCAQREELPDSNRRFEPNNTKLILRCCRPLMRLCFDAPLILEKLLSLLGTSRRADPMNAELLAEMGWGLAFMGRFSDAMELFTESTSVGGTEVAPYYGLVFCMMMENQLEDAEQQLEFLSVLVDSKQQTGLLLTLKAMLMWRKEHDQAAHISGLDEALAAHWKDIQGCPHDLNFYYYFNPQMLLMIVSEYLQHCVGTVNASEAMTPQATAMVKVQRLLQRIVRQIPAMIKAQLTLSHVSMLLGDLDGAQKVVATVLEMGPNCADAHLQSAIIASRSQNFAASKRALEQAVMADFEIRNRLEYFIVSAAISVAIGNVDDGISTLEKAAGLPEDESVSGIGCSKSSRSEVYLALADAYVAGDKLIKASTVIARALKDYAGTPEEARLRVAQSRVMLKNGDVKGALKILDAVDGDSPAFVSAQKVKADIYTSLQSPEKAVESLECALEKAPGDAQIGKRIGEVLVTTHDFDRAVSHYQAAVNRAPDKWGKRGSALDDRCSFDLRFELTDLLFRLGRHSDAIEVMEGVCREGADTVDDTGLLSDQVRGLLLMAEVYKEMGERGQRQVVLVRARNSQKKVLAHSSDAAHEKAVAAGVALKLGESFEEAKDLEKALSYLKEGLEHDETHEGCVLSLARVSLEKGDVDFCKHHVRMRCGVLVMELQCVQLLKMNPDSLEASLMLAKVFTASQDFEGAARQYEQTLRRDPTKFDVLEAYLEALRCAGKISSAEELMKLAEAKSPPRAAGLEYCWGLYYRHCNNAREALNHFNFARRSGKWGDRALFEMADTYLRPNNDNFYESFKGNEAEMHENVRTARELLSRVRNADPQCRRHVVLESYVLMASKDRHTIEQALRQLVELAKGDKGYVPALLGLACALLLQDQESKARNQLKTITKIKYTPEFAQEFEHGWLLLANCFIEMGKSDLAFELCRRVLKYNAGSGKANEMLGMVMEKERAFRDAAERYEKAWELDQKMNAKVGYKLAFNYLKAKRFVEAISIGHEILERFPDYPRVMEDIINPARMALRP